MRSASPRRCRSRSAPNIATRISRSGRATSSPSRPGRCSAPRSTTTAANCADRRAASSTPAPASAASRAAPRPVGAQGFPGIPAVSATDESRHSYAGYVELDTNLFEGFTAVLAGRYEHFSDFGDTVNGKLALRYEPVQRLCAARLDLQRLPGAVAPPAILHDDLDQLHQRLAGRHLDARGQQPGRARARLARPRAGKVAQPQLRRDRQSGPRA